MRVALVASLAVLLAGCTSSPCGSIEWSLDGAAGTRVIPTVEGEHRVRLLNDGFEALVERVRMIRAARESIVLQTFIWKNDEAGRLMLYELLEAARRGVVVRVIADQMFSENDAGDAAFAATAHERLRIKAYNPIAHRVAPTVLASLGELVTGFRDLNQRMHNKILVVDRERAITGGRNVQNAYFDLDPRLNYRDRDVRVVGPVAGEMAASFDDYWTSPLAVPLGELIDVAARIESGEHPNPKNADEMEVAALRTEIDRALLPVAGASTAGLLERTVSRVAFVADLPGKNESAWLDASGRITEQFGGLLCGARKELVIQSPYLVLGDAGAALMDDLRDDDVSILISTNSLAATDSWQTYGMFYQQKRMLLRDLDLDIYEFRPVPLGPVARRREADEEPFFCLHSKSMVVDDEIAVVGSYNLDPRSGNLNTEVALLVFDPEFAGLLENSIREDLAPDRSWVLGVRDRPLGIRQVANLLESASAMVQSVTTLDPWPSRYAACFELRPGQQPVDRRHPDFYDRYENLGNFPGLGIADQKVVFARLLKGMGGAVTPIL